MLILRNRLNSQIDRRDIQVIKNYGKLPPVECYSGQLNQVFMNLITNAIDALDDASQNQPHAALKILISTELAGPDRVRVRIADTGT
ncbi:histidine kinase, partial [Microcoleus sp. HI-ES]|nr:histidine kinase [Microcoleus sp. HI-ES]